MTDKQIIIDGVDVSGCENYGETMAKTHNCTLYDEYLRPCKGTDCYYKQLKAKEQECERLKEAQKNSRCAWKSFEGTFCPEAQEQLDQLKAENDELKRQRQGDKGLITSTGKMNYQLIQEYDKLKGKVKLYEEILERSAEGFETGTQASMFASMVKGVANSIRDEKLFKHKQTLTEIKEIAEKNLNIHTCAFKGCGYDLITKQILQKISECEVGNE